MQDKVHGTVGSCLTLPPDTELDDAPEKAIMVSVKLSAYCAYCSELGETSNPE